MDVDLARSATSCGRVRTDNLYAVMDLGKLQVLVYPQFSSVQLKMVSMRSEKAHMRSTPSLRSFPNVAFETVPMFV